MSRETDLIYKFAANPTVNDDSTLKYQVGDDWENITSGDVFTCRDITIGAAVWSKRLFDPLESSSLPTGIQGFFLEAKGQFGTGGGWADSAFIDDVPVLLFDGNQQEKAIFMFFAGARFLLADVDPIVLFIPWSTTAPSAGNNDVRLQLTCKYIAAGELTSKAADQVIAQTHTLSFLTADTQQPIIAFILDRTKIATGDVLNFKLERLAGDLLDTYNNNDLGIGQSGSRVELTVFNP